MSNMPVIALFESDSEARAAARRLISHGASRYAVSVFDPSTAGVTPKPRRLAGFFAGALFGAIEAAGLTIAARLYPQLGQAFAGDWTTAALAGAALGALAGGFIGFAIASVAVEKPKAAANPVSEGDWPAGALVAISAEPEQRQHWETVFRELGALNYTSAEAVKAPAPGAQTTRIDSNTVEYVPPSRTPAPRPSSAADTAAPVDFLGRKVDSPVTAPAPEPSAPAVSAAPEAMEPAAVETPLPYRRRASDVQVERRGVMPDRRQISR